MPIQNLGDTLGAFIDWARGILGAVQDEVTGSLDETVNAILDIKELDCGGEWTLYVKTAIPALKATMWLFIVPSFGEILENYLEPKAGRRGGRRGRRGERERRVNRAGARRLFFGGGIPDVDELIANRIPGRGFFKGRQVGPGEWLFWTGINVADSILWQWLLLEATETFATTWQSGLLESGQCVQESAAYAKVKGPVLSPGNSVNFWNSPLSLQSEIVHNIYTAVNGRLTLLDQNKVGKGFAIISVKFTFTNTASTGNPVFLVGFFATYLDPDGQSQLLIEKGGQLSVGPNSTSTIFVEGVIQVPISSSWSFTYRLETLVGGGDVTREAEPTVQISLEALGDV